jgi:hypothetical protein
VAMMRTLPVRTNSEQTLFSLMLVIIRLKHIMPLTVLLYEQSRLKKKLVLPTAGT